MYLQKTQITCTRIITASIDIVPQCFEEENRNSDVDEEEKTSEKKKENNV